VVEDLEVGVRLIPDTDQLEDDLEDADLTAGVGSTPSGAVGGGGTGGGAASLEAGVAGAEFGSDFATGKGKGGLAGGLAGISSRLTAVLGVLAVIAGVLATLEGIQQGVGLIAQQLELFVVPFITLLTPVLEDLNQAVIRLTKFLRNPTSVFGGDQSGLISDFETAGTSTAGGNAGNALSAGLGAGVLSVFGVGAGAGPLFSSMFADFSDEAKKERQGNEVEKQQGELFGGQLQ